MTPRQKIEIRAAELRAELGRLLGSAEEWTDEQRERSEVLRRELTDSDTKLAAAIAAETPPETREVENADTEARELAELHERANLGAIFAAVVEHRAIGGPEAELQQHYGIGSNMVPLEMIRPEERAISPAPGQSATAGTQTNQASMIQPVFAMGDAMYLGAAMPTVPSGLSAYPVLSTRPTVGGPHVGDDAVGVTTGAFTSALLAPSRLQAAFEYLRADAARFPTMGDALQTALQMGLSESIDAQVVAAIVAAVTRTDASAADSFASYRQRLVYAAVDGRYAPMESDIKLLVGHETLEDMSTLYRSNNADDSAVDSLRRVSGGLRVSAHIADAASNKQDVIVRRGMRDDLHAPMWQGVTLIPDEITLADKGEIRITAVLLAAFNVTRAAAFARIQSQHA